MSKLFLATVAIATILSGCNKKNMDPGPKTSARPDTIAKTKNSLAGPPPANGQPVSVSINQAQPGFTIAANFAGITYETGSLVSDFNYLSAGNTKLVQLMKNLGSGIIRVGGTSSDLIHWTGQARNAHTGSDSITTTDIDRLAGFVNAIGGSWKVLFGLNMGTYNPSASANEAIYVSHALGNNLYAFQFGNEPLSYGKDGLRPSGWNIYDYMANWRIYRDSVRHYLPQVPIAGPDISRMLNQAGSALKVFADTLHSDINLLTGHYYGNSYATTNSTDLEVLFDTVTSATVYAIVPPRLAIINNLAASYNLPYRITESNAATSGMNGITSAYANAIWALDFMWQAATNNCQGVNLNGSWVRPNYYGMLAFKYGAAAGSRILPAALAANGKLCTAYATVNNGTTYVTLVNRDTANLSYTINLTNTATQMSLYRLTAPSITATTGITFAGASVNADGTFAPGTTEQYTVGGTSSVVNVPAHTAVVAAFQ